MDTTTDADGGYKKDYEAICASIVRCSGKSSKEEREDDRGREEGENIKC
jgi:hypothetical protein